MFKLAFPGPLSDLERVDIAPLLDGTLVSITGGRAILQGASGSAQTLLFVDADGKVEHIATRAIAHDFPQVFEHADWWLSPALHALVHLPARLYDDGSVPDLEGNFYPARPPAVWSAALLFMLSSFAVACYWRRTVAGVAPGWLPACALLGLPCLGAMLILHPRPQAQPAPLRAAATAA